MAVGWTLVQHCWVKTQPTKTDIYFSMWRVGRTLVRQYWVETQPTLLFCNLV